MLDDFRNVSQVINHLVRDGNGIGTAFVSILFLIIKAMKLEMAFGLCDSVFALIVPTNKRTAGIAKEWVEKILLCGYEFRDIGEYIWVVFGWGKGPLILFLHFGNWKRFINVMNVLF